ncbi:chitinase [Saitoella complicata NRRL Y-17804]|uniref:chitinase n=1 Tax=Saitoella complicata (strain BCRC 22490 / CBS 7301 / JCM 7358 / NBRC 10748 / NRRL Y-17804) TaxID=698492 RepID=A0A0E9NDV4_SAICN|nr:chitinase [Saitoella complicata NRRL Y-17804]ODQ52403.1 chitinase [Saitoella complicata NRRL Y-17804]GAO47590.1 hypothetical protein G7K_1792-t1 [Saitoella complicata NRRL Y-17804]
MSFFKRAAPPIPFRTKPKVDRPYINAIYYANWTVYKGCTPASLDLSKITHVFYAFVRIRPEDGSVYLSDEGADVQMNVDGADGGCLGSFQRLKQQYPHLKVILSLGGGGEGSSPFAAVCRNTSMVQNLVRSARELVDRWSLDGIDVDWEHPSNAEEGRAYINLLKALREVLPTPDYLLTTALPIGQWALQHIPLDEARGILDYINVMAYDMSGPWAPQSGHHAQLHSHSDKEASGSQGVAYMKRKGVPAHKLVLGLPLYSRAFLGVTGPAQKYSSCSGEEGTFPYNKLPLDGAYEWHDEPCCAGGSYDGAKGEWMSYDIPVTTQRKCDWIRQEGLGGAFFWEASGDKPAVSGASLIQTSYHALGGEENMRRF